MHQYEIKAFYFHFSSDLYLICSEFLAILFVRYTMNTHLQLIFNHNQCLVKDMDAVN